MPPVLGGRGIAAAAQPRHFGPGATPINGNVEGQILAGVQTAFDEPIEGNGGGGGLLRADRDRGQLRIRRWAIDLRRAATHPGPLRGNKPVMLTILDPASGEIGLLEIVREDQERFRRGRGLANDLGLGGRRGRGAAD